MRWLIRSVAAVQAALIFPAALFLASIIIGVGDPPQYELAHVAQRIVKWYAGQRGALLIALLALPLVAMVSGGATLLRSWNSGEELPQPVRLSLSGIPAPLATLLVGAMTLTAAGILVVVALHIGAN